MNKSKISENSCPELPGIGSRIVLLPNGYYSFLYVDRLEEPRRGEKYEGYFALYLAVFLDCLVVFVSIRFGVVKAGRRTVIGQRLKNPGKF